MRFTQPGPYFLALLVALSIPSLGCGRGVDEAEQDQVSIEQEDAANEDRDPEVQTRQIEVIEPEAGDDAGADPALDERERRLAERQAELDAREERLREQQEAPGREARVSSAPPASPTPRAPRAPVTAPQPKPEPREEERQARAPQPAPRVEQPARKPAEPEEPREPEIAEVEDVEDVEVTDSRADAADAADTEREREEQAVREEREARRREERETRQRDTEREVEEERPAEREARRAESAPAVASVPAGTVMEAQFLEGVSSETSEPGDIFRARIANDVTTGGGVAIPAGSEVIGVVTEAVATRKVGGRAKLAVKFTDLVLPSGGTVPIRASFVEEGRSQTGKDAATIGGSAAGGAVLGRILNRKDRSRGAVIGAIIGAAAGTILASRTPGEEVVIPEGTVVNLKLDDGVEIRRRR